MENAFPGSNILVVTLTNGESKRVEAQSDQETLKEAMGVLRDMFGPNIPNATDILVPRWWNNRFQRGSYSNYPIFSNLQDVQNIKVLLLTLHKFVLMINLKYEMNTLIIKRLPINYILKELIYIYNLLEIWASLHFLFKA